jgi:hypothetical protein
MSLWWLIKIFESLGVDVGEEVVVDVVVGWVGGGDGESAEDVVAGCLALALG